MGHPELGYKEFHATKTVSEALGSLRLKVETPPRWRSPVVAFLAREHGVPAEGKAPLRVVACNGTASPVGPRPEATDCQRRR